MDKKSLLGLGAITLVVIVWLIYTSVNTQPPEVSKQNTEEYRKEADSSVTEKAAEEEKPAETVQEATIPVKEQDSSKLAAKYGSAFLPFINGENREITIQTDLVTAKLTNKGAALTYWQLKKYDKWDKVPSQLIQNKEGELYLKFLTMQGKKIDSRDFFFSFDKNYNVINLSKDDSVTITAYLKINTHSAIVKKFTFYGNKYHIDCSVSIENLDDFIPSRGYDFYWSKGLKNQEHNSVDESNDAVAMVSMNGSTEELNADGDNAVKSSSSGIIDYAGIKSKYFGVAIIPVTKDKFDGTVDLEGSLKHVKKEGIVEYYSMSFRIPYRGGVETQNFRVYIGPLDYDIVTDYGLGDMINFGWKWLVRPIGEFFMLPIFKFIHSIVPNYGIAIILFSILMKFLLYPLSIQQLRSSQKMQIIAPEVNAMREKFKDDQTRQQQETMKLYSEYGINPMGGCLPLILQMPILYALWSVLRTAIDLRHAHFFWWITDLSAPDIILMLPFKILFIESFSGLALFMGITMFFQQKMTVTDPRQKAMVYMMPVMFTLMFSSFPSGLNLYYFMFNLLSILQQVYINKFSRKKPTLADLKRMPKKEGWLQRKMREAQDIAASQGRHVPGQSSQSQQKKSGQSSSKSGSQQRGGRKR
ncbi:MAG: YidC/Oxa1 family rane protein insertase [Bacteroidota bacterium]|nr:YidC/Oxa1 family rane protein insertase [Bacteroidota bacterium]